MVSMTRRRDGLVQLSKCRPLLYFSKPNIPFPLLPLFPVKKDSQCGAAGPANTETGACGARVVLLSRGMRGLKLLLSLIVIVAQLSGHRILRVMC